MRQFRLRENVILLAFLFLGTFHCFINLVTADAAVYKELVPLPCIRMLNSTGVIGCQVLQPVTGILYQVNSSDDIKSFIEKDLKGQYAIVMPYELITTQILRELESSSKFGGIIAIINGTSGFAPRPKAFSPDATCPNCQFGLYSDENYQYQWNPNGLGLIQERFDFPIFAVCPFDNASTDTYNRIIEGAAKNMEKSFKAYPLKAIQFRSLMFAAVDASTCLRRGYCLPVGGLSVYSTPSISISTNDNKPIIVVAAAMDSSSLFHLLTLGVDNGISGTIALLSVADAISRSQVDLDKLPKHILYTLFDGEAWGFAGSSRFVSDISQFKCQINNPTNNCPYKGSGCGLPCREDLNFTRINFSNIESIFEFSLVGMNTNGFYVHVDSNNTLNVELIKKMNNISATINNGSAFVYAANANGINNKLPPSSSMAFLEKNRNLAAVVLGDFQNDLKNYYNSEYDDGFNISDDSIINSICSIANVTAQTVWLQAQGPNYSNISISVDCTLVKELFNCLMYNYSCSLSPNLPPRHKNQQSSGRIVHYSSVYQFNDPGYMPQFVSNFLINLNSSKTPCTTSENCQNGENCIRNRCVNSKTITKYHDAYGAGLQYNQDGNFIVTDPTKAAWVESQWDTYDLRIFSVSSLNNQICEFVLGCSLTIMSIIGVLYGKKHLNKTLKIS